MFFIAESDFGSTAITTVFLPGDQSQVVRISLVCDTDVEGTETFTMSLSTNVTNSRLRIGTPSAAIGIIEDSTSKCYITACIVCVSCIFVQ